MRFEMKNRGEEDLGRPTLGRTQLDPPPSGHRSSPITRQRGHPHRTCSGL